MKGKNLLDCGCGTTTADFVQVFGKGEDFGEGVLQGVGWVKWVSWVRCKEEITACRGLFNSLLADDTDLAKVVAKRWSSPFLVRFEGLSLSVSCAPCTKASTRRRRARMSQGVMVG